LEQMAVAGTVPRPCVGRIIRCASRSTCGKAGAVTCQVPASTCDSATGTCSNDPSQGCSADSDCGTTCRIASSSDSCQTGGGSVGTSATCCSTCTTTTTTTLPTTTTTAMTP